MSYHNIRKDLWSCKKVNEIYYITCRSDEHMKIVSVWLENPSLVVDLKLAVQKILDDLVE